MLERSAAQRIILGAISARPHEEGVPLAEAAGRVLARGVTSDVDLPPFEKSAMDGFAVHSADFERDAERTLPIVGESRAGAPFGGEVPRGACAAIYTGAELPRGADAVVVVERSEILDQPDEMGRGRVRLRDRPLPGQHLCAAGSDLRRGRTAFGAGHRIRDRDLALLAAVGADPCPVLSRPRVAILTSGDELVTPDARPGRGQIREGNTLHLAALCARSGARIVERGIVTDDPSELRARLERALGACDALITTGGVSMGRYDLVGETLAGLGVEPRFHKVAIKPGKPLWFGVRGSVPVFALPGNPVSCLVNCELFVAPALRRLGGEDPDPAGETPRRGRWLGGEVAPNPREQYLPVRTRPGADGVEELEAVPWNGSADVVGIAAAQALAVVGAGEGLARGALVPFRPLT